MIRDVIEFVLGTRPEAIKLGPVVAELEELKQPTEVVLTGQHTTLLDGTPALRDLGSCTNLDLPSQGVIGPWVNEAERALLEYWQEVGLPRTVVVQGDTMSAYAAAGAAVRRVEIQLVHVEAGLRTFNITNPWPEELFRQSITKWAHWHLAPTPLARENLLNDHVQEHRICVVGSPSVAALARYATLEPAPPESHIFVTLHRRELLEKNAKQVVRAFFEQAEQYPSTRFVWPVHPHLRKAVGERNLGAAPSNLVLAEPMRYTDTVEMIRRARAVITDSGGVQEEAAILGVPHAVVRVVSDRPESIEAGLGQLFEPTPLGIRSAISWATGSISKRMPLTVFGRGDVAGRMAEKLAAIRADTLN